MKMDNYEAVSDSEEEAYHKKWTYVMIALCNVLLWLFCCMLPFCCYYWACCPWYRLRREGTVYQAGIIRPTAEQMVLSQSTTDYPITNQAYLGSQQMPYSAQHMAYRPQHGMYPPQPENFPVQQTGVIPPSGTTYWIPGTYTGNATQPQPFGHPPSYNDASNSPGIHAQVNK